MKIAESQINKVIRFSFGLVALFLFSGLTDSQARTECALELEKMCAVENIWENFPDRKIHGSSESPNVQDLYVHRHGGCGQDEFQSEGMGCGHGRGMHHRGRHGRHHGAAQDSEREAQCPQERTTTSAPTSYWELKNPLEPSTANIRQGKLIFQQTAEPACAMCHGMAGDGLGQMASGLNPPPRNFTCGETMKSIPDGQLFFIIKNGSDGTGMPAFTQLSDESVWQLILFIRQLAE